MVFGWGKKKEANSDELPLQKNISISEVPKITQQILELRSSQILSDIKSIRDLTEPMIKELIAIGNSLEKDDLQVNEIDKHLRIIVVRGKQQVIDMIKKDASHLPNIATYGDAELLSNTLHQMLKKIGDVLGRQTRVIHIFAKKYAEKLKEILIQMNSNHAKIRQLLENYDDSKSTSSQIFDSLQEIHDLENELDRKKNRAGEIHENITSFDKKIFSCKDTIGKIKASDEYKKFLDLKATLNNLDIRKNQIKNEIDSQFTKISRPLGRYEHVSALDKEQKNLLSKLIEDPFDIMLAKNKDFIILILENIRKGISSGSISVKDVDKSFSQLTEIEESLDDFIKQVADFDEKKQSLINQINLLESDDLKNLESDLEITILNKKESELKIKTFEDEIKEIETNIPKLVAEIESKLRKFSNTVYSITY